MHDVWKWKVLLSLAAGDLLNLPQSVVEEVAEDDITQTQQHSKILNIYFQAAFVVSLVLLRKSLRKWRILWHPECVGL